MRFVVVLREGPPCGKGKPPCWGGKHSGTSTLTQKMMNQNTKKILVDCKPQFSQYRTAESLFRCKAMFGR